MLERKEAGDEEARNILVERNLRLVAHVVKKYDVVGEETDDLISIGAIGLIKAINTFDRQKKTRLATYAARCIENEILMHLRSGRKNRGELSLYDPIGADKEGNEIVLMDVLTNGGDTVAYIVESRVEQERLVEKLAKLSPRERKVLELRFGMGDMHRRTQREISRALGISRSVRVKDREKGPGQIDEGDVNTQLMRGILLPIAPLLTYGWWGGLYGRRLAAIAPL